MDSNYRAEVEKLARTLKASRVAVSEGEAYRMAEEMLATSRKVHEDHKAREREMYGDTKRNVESENAQRIMEKISANMAKGNRDVRIDLGEIDVARPLKELVGEEEQVQEREDDDDAVLLHEAPVAEPAHFSAVVTPAEADGKPEVIDVHSEDDDYYDDDQDDDGSEEEKASGDGAANSEPSEEEQGEVSVKEVNFF